MGFTLPQALAGSDNEVEVSEDGLRRVLGLIGGTGAAIAIVAAAAALVKWAAGLIGMKGKVDDLY